MMGGASHRRLVMQKNETSFLLMGSFRQSNMNESTCDSCSDDNSESGVDSNYESSANEDLSADFNCCPTTQPPPSTISLPISVDTNIDLNDDHLHGEDDQFAIDKGDESLPPTPWSSSTAKKRIITELKDENSDIHLLIGQYTSTTTTTTTMNR